MSTGNEFESVLNEPHLAYLREFYNSAPTELTWGGRHYRRLLAHYYRNIIPGESRVLEVGCGSGYLLSLLPNRDITGVDVSEKQIESARKRIPHGSFYVQAGEELSIEGVFDYIILSDTVNFASDVQRLLEKLHPVSHPQTRLILNFHSAVWRPILSLATALGFKSPHPANNWLASTDMQNLLYLAGWELIKQQARVLQPVPFLGLEKFLNRFVAPFVAWFCLCVFQIARPAPKKTMNPKSVSVIIPARNEAGNIEAAIRRIPPLGSSTEIIYIEGHSADNTWEEIQRVAGQYPHLDIKTLRQTGKGKGNAVREAFDAATGDILMVLDADLTMPPEDLPKFYDVLASGRAEFANGVRLVYPMEERAMQFLNLCANKAFSLLFTWALDQSIKDTLCGTKVLFREDYRRIAANRTYFGDFDPFGDFDLIFGADRLNLKMADVPIRYRERVYGDTNIQRWRHGVLLTKMFLLAAQKIKFI